MSGLTKFALGAFIAGNMTLVVSPSNAGGEMVRTTPPKGEEARPCRVFIHRHLPAPRHCYRFFSNIFGPDVYVHGDYVFRDREAFLDWHERHEAGPGRLAEPQDRYAARERERHLARAEAQEHRYDGRDHDRYGPQAEDRTDRYAERDERRYAAREEARQPAYADDREEVSGGAARGPGGVHETSGGATRGAEAEQSASGGATRGERVQQHASGGASGY